MTLAGGPGPMSNLGMASGAGSQRLSPGGFNSNSSLGNNTFGTGQGPSPQAMGGGMIGNNTQSFGGLNT